MYLFSECTEMHLINYINVTVFSWSINIIYITNLLPVDYIFLQETHSVPEPPLHNTIIYWSAS